MLNNEEKHYDFKSLFTEVKEDLTGYLNNRLNFYKLKTYEKGSKGGAFIAYGLIVSVLVFTIFLLILLTLGFFLGELLNSFAAGFGILILITAIILGICIARAKYVRRSLTNLTISIIKKIETDED